MSSNTHIFIGFGGSGCKTLAQLCHLLSDDARLCPLADTLYYFLFVDTDRADMREHHAKSVQFLKRGSVNPYCQMISLADDAEPTLGPMVQKFFSPATARGAPYTVSEEMKAHWWHDAKGDPFQASKLVEPPWVGAGQCPPVAYFLGWRFISKLERAIEQCCEQMVIRQRGTPRENISATLHLVAGLSGGTGRGCWHLLSLKAREMLRKMGMHSKATGYFYDQSVMSDVIRANSARRLQMQVNSLTGLSELLMWMRNDERGSRKQDYVLPNPSMPGDSDRAITSLSRISPMKGARGWSPIDLAWIIGGNSRSVPSLGSASEYYKMVGGVLYSQLLQSKVNSGASNEPANLGSVAVAIGMVPTIEISHWLVEEAKLRMVDHVLGSVMVGASYLDSALAQLADLQKESMLRPTHAEASKFFANLARQAQSEMKHDGQIDLFRKHMKEQGPGLKKAETCEAQIRDDAKDVSKSLQAAFRKYLSSKFFDGKSAEDYLAEKTRLDLESVEKRHPIGLAGSRANMRATAIQAKKIARHLQEQADALVEPRRQAATGFHAQFEIDKKREGLLSKVYFTDAEISRLASRAEDVLIHSAVIATCKALAAEFEVVSEAASALEGASVRASGELESARDKEMLGFDELSHGERFGSIFTTDLENLDKGYTDDAFLRKRTALRIFRPFCDIERARDIAVELLERANENPRYLAQSAKLFELVAECAVGRGQDQRASAARVKSLRACIQEMQSLLIAPVDLVAKHFSVTAVLRDLIPHWVEALNQARGVRRNELALRYARLFGSECPKEGDEYVQRPPVEVISELASDLAACCDPFIRFEEETQRKREAGDEVLVFLPTDPELAKAADSIKDSPAFRSNKLAEAASVIACEGDTGTPFAIVAFAQERMNYMPRSEDDLEPRHIDFTTTLDYWKGPELKARLEAVESQGGVGFFDPPSDSYGFGHLAPFMVRDDHWSALRWAPWATKARIDQDKQAKLDAQRHLEAMAWLLAGLAEPDGAADSEADIPIDEILLDVASRHRWDLRNLKRTDGSGFELTRELYSSKGGRLSPSDDSVGPDAVGFKELTSLRPLEEALASDRNAVDAVLAERELFFGICEEFCKRRYVPIGAVRAALHRRILAFVEAERRRVQRLRGPAAKPILETVKRLEEVTAQLAVESE
jgi:hypothetical protein